MTDEPKRKRGGQPGNRNARKYHTPLYTPEDIALLNAARDTMLGTIDEEIAFFRVKLRDAIARQPDNLHLILLAFKALVKLVRARQYIERLHS